MNASSESREEEEANVEGMVFGIFNSVIEGVLLEGLVRKGALVGYGEEKPHFYFICDLIHSLHRLVSDTTFPEDQSTAILTCRQSSCPQTAVPQEQPG